MAFSVEVNEQERLVIVQELEPRARTVDSGLVFQAVRQATSTVHELEAYAIVLAKAGSIPTTTSGKRRRSDCRHLYLQGQLEFHAKWIAETEDGNLRPLVAPRPESVRQPTAKEIEFWLIQRIAARMGVSASQIQVSKPFAELGMGSLDAVEVAADLEHWLNRRLPPMAIYNYPNISSLANWLASTSRAAPPPETGYLPPPRIYDPNQMLREIQQLSQAEIEASIGQEANQSR